MGGGGRGLSLSVVNILFCFVLFACSLADLLPDKNHCSRVTIFLRGGEEGRGVLFVTTSSICSLRWRKRITTLNEAKYMSTTPKDRRQSDNN